MKKVKKNPQAIQATAVPTDAGIADSATGTAVLPTNEEALGHLRTPKDAPSPSKGSRQSLAIKAKIATAEAEVSLRPSSDNFLELSLAYYNAGRFHDCIAAARQALRERPNFAEAYNNIGAAYQSMAEWDSAIEALHQALRIAPKYQLALNNLAFCQTRKRLSATH